MNAVVAAVLLAVVATCSGTGVVSTLGGSQLLYAPQTLGYTSGLSGYQYVLPSSQYQYQYQQPIVSSSNVVSSASVPVTYASQGVIPSTYYGSYGLNYPYVYSSYVPLKK